MIKEDQLLFGIYTCFPHVAACATLIVKTTVDNNC